MTEEICTGLPALKTGKTIPPDRTGEEVSVEAMLELCVGLRSDGVGMREEGGVVVLSGVVEGMEIGIWEMGLVDWVLV